MHKVIRHAAAAAGTAAVMALALGVAGCGPAANETARDDGVVSVERAADDAGVSVSDVEAVVNGKVITHEDVDARVTRMRSTSGLENDGLFSQYLDAAGSSQTEYRRSALKSLVDEALILTDGETLGVTLNEEDYNAQIDELASRYPSRKAFLEALQQAGYTEESYRNATGASILSSRLREKVTADIEPTDEEVYEYAQVVAPTLEGRRSSLILFAQDDLQTARDVRDQIEEGADFAQLARRYSIDGSAEDGGDMGWEATTSLTGDYRDALDSLDVGEVSPVVRTEFGYAIIECTGIYTPEYKGDGSVSIANIPGDLMDYIRSSMISALADRMYATYISNLEATAALAVFDQEGNQLSPADVGLTTQVADVGPDVSIDVTEVAAQEGADSDDPASTAALDPQGMVLRASGEQG